MKRTVLKTCFISKLNLILVVQTLHEASNIMDVNYQWWKYMFDMIPVASQAVIVTHIACQT